MSHPLVLPGGFSGLSQVQGPGLELLHYNWCSWQDIPERNPVESTWSEAEDNLVGSAPGKCGWASGSMLFEVASLLDSWGPPREWGDAPNTPMGLLQVLLKVRELCSLEKERPQWCRGLAPPGALPEATAKQSQAQEKAKQVLEEVRLERDLRVARANSEDILGRQ